ncbi:DUF5384 family protein [Swaminathania salitolerans]|uniref:DUF5384 family protein n=1 Tax=Swaminathania salitolerans TaxID=182838 RepID=A0A511BQA5_9PROT|nr:DUF5384 family protein [Swaminathania salitolerans]GBQ11514.1 hypothetical protein AA21291_0849 [Swaminathania salitolerans LMG 21291]GEL02509.1 hypothetical protein SSA02_16720 [Swaminathania salitolerans]
MRQPWKNLGLVVGFGVLCGAGLIAGAAPGQAQTALDAQIGAVANAEHEEQERYRRAYEAQVNAYKQEKAAREKRAAARQRSADARAREAAAAAAADKKRDQGYEDQMRALALEERRLKLQAAKTRIARENEFIDRELHEKDAETDVIKSHADAARNLSAGSKTLLEKKGEQAVLEGQAAVKKESGWFH